MSPAKDATVERLQRQLRHIDLRIPTIVREARVAGQESIEVEIHDNGVHGFLKEQVEAISADVESLHEKWADQRLRIELLVRTIIGNLREAKIRITW